MLLAANKAPPGVLLEIVTRGLTMQRPGVPDSSCDEQRNVQPIGWNSRGEHMLSTRGLDRKPQVCRGTQYRRELAWRALGINSADVQRIPYFETQLRKIARIAHVADGYSPSRAPAPALALLEASAEPEAIKVRKAYLSIPPSYRRLLPPEAFCHAAGVSPWAVLDAITVATVRRGAMASAIVAAVNQPRVVQKTIDIALTDEGVRERIAFHKASGWI